MLALLASPLVRAGMLALLLLGGLYLVRQSGVSAGKAEVQARWDAASRAAAARAEKRDDAGQTRVDDTSEASLITADAELKRMQEERDAYLASGSVAPGCVSDRALIDRMRRPAQGAGARSGSSAIRPEGL